MTDVKKQPTLCPQCPFFLPVKMFMDSVGNGAFEYDVLSKPRDGYTCLIDNNRDHSMKKVNTLQFWLTNIPDNCAYKLEAIVLSEQNTKTCTD